MSRSGIAFQWRTVILGAGVLCAVVAGGVPPPPVRLADYAAAAGHLRLVAAAAHTAGLEGTAWVTDLEIHNPGRTSAFGFLFLLKTGEDSSDAEGRPFNVGAGASLRLTDVVRRTFGESRATGGVLVGSDAELIVTSRTYNDHASGTFGQYVEGYAHTEALQAGATATLIQLTENAAFRTNLGIVNAGATGFDADVDFFRSNGQRLGSRQYQVGPFMHLQDVKVLARVTSGDVDDGYAVVTTSTPGARYFVYASVNDNRTGDPMQVVPATVSSGAAVYLPGAARVGGFGGTAWRTDLEVHNPGSSQARFTLELLARGEENAAPAQRVLNLAGGLPVRYVNVLPAVPGTDGAATPRLTPTQGRLAATQRTHNNQPAGTPGQPAAGLPEDAAAAWGQTARTVQPPEPSSDTTGPRTNLGLANATGAPTVVTAQPHRADGVKLGVRTYELPAYGHEQEDRAPRKVTAEAVGAGHAVLTTATPAGRFFAHASVVDNRSGDPVTVPAQVVGPPPCSYAIDPTSGSHDAGEGGGTIYVTTDEDCSWRVESHASWIAVPLGPKVGSKAIGHSLEANPASSQRVGTLTVAGEPSTVMQAGAPCTHTLDPTGRSHGAGAETGSFTVSSPAGCAWAPAGTASWVQVTGGASGSGNGTVSYQLAANSGADRAASIVVHGVPFTLTQKGAAEITVTLPGGVPLTMVRFPAGTFQMGSPASERGREPGVFSVADETLHTVTLTRDYYVGKTEVTQRQWRAVVGSNPPSVCGGSTGSHGVGDLYPAYCVSWTEICGGTTGSDCAPASFIGKLNAYLGTTAFRLPTEAEWERAARAGTATRFSHGDVLGCDDECGACSTHTAHMWWCGNAGGSTHPVGLKAANGWGLHDVHGNVWELVPDWYAPFSTAAVTDPTGPATGSARVGRGGDWGLGAAWCRSAQRAYGPPETRVPGLGFRLAR